LSFHTPPSSSLYSLSLHDALPIFVHIDSGVSALVACLILGKRVGYPQEPMPPHSLTLTSVGTGLLWVGWFGFNAGSALEANGSAGLAMINTFVATASAGLVWMIVERIFGHKPS